MSTMLEQALVDAGALKEAALKTPKQQFWSVTLPM